MRCMSIYIWSTSLDVPLYKRDDQRIRTIAIITFCGSAVVLIAIFIIATAALILGIVSYKLGTENNKMVQQSLFFGCYSDTAACEVLPARTNLYRFLCITNRRQSLLVWLGMNLIYYAFFYSAAPPPPPPPVSHQNFYTVGMNCQYEANANYLDSTLLKTSGSDVWCKCDVVGITRNGSHVGTFNPIPGGECRLIITRCPLTRKINWGHNWH